jgi:hypothetical protein
MDTVPFHFDAFGGFGEVQGIAQINEHGLELQFSTRDALFGVLKTGQRSVRVPLSSLLSVRYSAGWFWLMPRIELRVRDLAVLKDLPESEQGRVTLKLALRDRHDGRAFAADLDLMRSRLRVLQLDRDLDRLSNQLSMPTSPTGPAQDVRAEATAPQQQAKAPPSRESSLE